MLVERWWLGIEGAVHVDAATVCDMSCGPLWIFDMARARPCAGRIVEPVPGRALPDHQLGTAWRGPCAGSAGRPPLSRNPPRLLFGRRSLVRVVAGRRARRIHRLAPELVSSGLDRRHLHAAVSRSPRTAVVTQNCPPRPSIAAFGPAATRGEMLRLAEGPVVGAAAPSRHRRETLKTAVRCRPPPRPRHRSRSPSRIRSGRRGTRRYRNWPADCRLRRRPSEARPARRG